ncbi:hypothetical protein Efla_005296 [Eimeria flavescens]
MVARAPLLGRCPPVQAGLLCRLLLLLLASSSSRLGQANHVGVLTHAAEVHAEEASGKAPPAAPSSSSSAAPAAAASLPSSAEHQWGATCAAYKKVLVGFPKEKLEATYDLGPLVDGAPHAGWACKAAEPLFELDEYPPFFRSVLSILMGDDEKEEREKPKENALHKHKDKHVFFAFNPCRLLPHTCSGSRGRLFKFAAKLLNPHAPEEEMHSLLSRITRKASLSASSDPQTEEEEEADPAECLQNVLPANTTMLYAHRHATSQQHPNSNGLGGLWEDPGLSDDPTPWEPLDPRNPSKGLKASFRHTHIFCPEASLFTHIELRCSEGDQEEDKNTKFNSCEHTTPCLFKMVLTSKAACPTAVSPAGSHEKATAAAAALNGGFGAKASSFVSSEGLKEKAADQEHERRPHKLKTQESDAAGPAGAGFLPYASSSFGSHRHGGSVSSPPPFVPPADGAESALGLWWWLPPLSSLLSLGLRLVLCVLIFAWMLYAIRDWTQSKMEYSPFPAERPADSAAPAAKVNSYDSCVEALVQTQLAAARAEAGGPACELATSTASGQLHAAVGAEGKPAFQQPARRELRGLFSSPGRRFVSIWLPQTLEAAAHNAQALAAAAHSVCLRVAAVVSPTSARPSGAFAIRRGRSEGPAAWDWTEAVEAQETEGSAPPTSPRPPGVLGHCGYETI